MVDIVNVGLKVDSRDVRAGTRELDRFGEQAGKTGRKTKKLETATGKLSSSFEKLRRIMAAAFAGVLIKKIIDNTIAQEQAIAQLDAALISTKGAVGLTSKELQKMASEMQAVSTYGDEVVMGMQSILLTFTKIGRETFPRASEAVADLAARMGMDLKSAALQVGKALNDPATGLSMLTRAGIQFTDAQKEVIKGLADTGHLAEAQALILKELETQFGGSARAARNTLGGALSALKNAFGDLLEADGGVNGATSAINDLTQTLSSEQTKKAFAVITTAVIDTMGWLAKLPGEFALRWSSVSTQFFETGKDIESALNEITKMIKEASDYWGTDGSSSAGFIADAFANLPANIRAAIKLATIEIAAFVDKTVAYGAAIFDALNPGNWFDGKDIGKELESKIKTIDSARKISIESILKERDAIVKRSEAELEAAKVSFDAEKARREARAATIAASAEETREAEAAAASVAAAEATAAEEDARLEQELNRAIHDEEELERIYEQNQRKLEAEKAYHDELYNISSEFEWNIAGLKKAIKDEEYKDVVAHGLNLLMFASQNSKKMHGIYKAAAIAKTVIDTYTAAEGAYSSLASIPIVGPALGIAAAAAAVASGMARVKAIQSTSIGSSSVSSGGGSAAIGSQTPAAGSATAPITTTQEQPVKHDVSIVVSGGLHSDEDVRNLVARINEIQEDMGQVSLVTS